MLISRPVSHHRPGVRDDQPFQYDTNGWFSLEHESLLLCSLAVSSLRIPWAVVASLNALARLAFFTGSGYLTERGMGATAVSITN